jgi:pectate lyase
MPTIRNRHIRKPGQLGAPYTADDGLGLWDGCDYKVINCTIDMSDAEDCDEAVAITYGASATFTNCIIRGAGKLALCGSGDSSVANKENGKHVLFDHCILENCGRRAPEVQAGMEVILDHCLIRNWADPGFFSVRGFGAWAHHGGRILARNCVFWQDSFHFSFKDMFNHVGQAVNDRGLLQIFNLKNYRPGCCRALTAGVDGCVEAVNCYASKWWLSIEGMDDKMGKDEASDLIISLEAKCGCK